MRQVIVGCDTAPACALYESIGFRRYGTIVGYSR
jgi:ribosomal protein S18 acetylase RimI-like enzyme